MLPSSVLRRVSTRRLLNRSPEVSGLIVISLNIHYKIQNSAFAGNIAYNNVENIK